VHCNVKVSALARCISAANTVRRSTDIFNKDCILLAIFNIDCILLMDISQHFKLFFLVILFFFVVFYCYFSAAVIGYQAVV
jgi:hypothetical protein